MEKLEINKKLVLERIDTIQKSLDRLNQLKGLRLGRFMLDDNFAIAEHYLRYALEATFDICVHILSRIPGVKIDEYKQIAVEMGKQGFVPKDFAKNQLYQMAGYRNRLTHFYLEISSKELYEFIQKDLGDFDIFLEHIKKIFQQS